MLDEVTKKSGAPVKQGGSTVPKTKRKSRTSNPEDIPVVPTFHWEYKLSCAGQNFVFPKTKITQQQARQILRALKHHQHFLHPQTPTDTSNNNTEFNIRKG